MKRILLSLSFLLVLASNSAAQNVQCADRPVGDSSNACANTRFVQNAIIAAGTGWTNNRKAITAAYTVVNGDRGYTIAASGTNYEITFGAASGYNSTFVANVLNESTTAPKTVVLTGRADYVLGPGQSVIIYAQNNVWYAAYSPVNVNVKDFGAKGDSFTTRTAAIASGTASLSNSSITCVPSDVGKTIDVYGAGAAGATLHTTILTCIGPTTFGLASNASTTIASSGVAQFGTDDHTAIQAAITYAYNYSIAFQPKLVDTGSYLQAVPNVVFPPGAYYSSDANFVSSATSIEASGVVFYGPDNFPGGAAYFDTLSSYGCSPNPCNGRFFFMNGGAFNRMEGHVNIFNGNVGGGKISFTNTEFWGSVNWAVTMKAESSNITFTNTTFNQNGFNGCSAPGVCVGGLRVLQTQNGGVAQVVMDGGYYGTPPATNTTEYYNVEIDGCTSDGVNGNICQTGTSPCVYSAGNPNNCQAAGDVIIMRNVLWGGIAGADPQIDPAFIRFKNGQRLLLEKNRFPSELGGMAMANLYTAYRIPGASNNIDTLASVEAISNELYADATLTNDKNAGFRIFQVPNQITMRRNEGSYVTGPVLAAGTGVNLTTLLASATGAFVKLDVFDNQFPNSSQGTVDLSWIPTQLRAYLVPVNTPTLNVLDQINLYSAGGLNMAIRKRTGSSAQPTVEFGDNSGVPAVSATLPLAINATTGNITCTGCLTNAPAALTKVDDTNVTITLGGTPATSLLQAVSLTMGWTGTLAAGRLNSNVVQSIVNDTNVTGSISAQALTLGWTGRLAFSRLTQGASNTVLANVTGSTADFAAYAMTNCSAASCALGWTANTGFTVNNAIAASTATTATNATNATNGATVATSTAASFYPLFAAASSNSNQPFNLSSNWTFNPSSSVMTITAPVSTSRVAYGTSNGGGTIFFGQECSTGACVFVGTGAYATFIGGTGANDMNLLTNSAVGFTIKNGGGSAGQAQSLSTTDSTSGSTGGFIALGGIGAAKAIWTATDDGTVPTTVAGIGTCNSARQGARRFVTDSNAASFTAGIGSVLASGGTTAVPVTCDGTNWRIGANDNLPKLNKVA